MAGRIYILNQSMGITLKEADILRIYCAITQILRKKSKGIVFKNCPLVRIFHKRFLDIDRLLPETFLGLVRCLPHSMVPCCKEVRAGYRGTLVIDVFKS